MSLFLLNSLLIFCQSTNKLLITSNEKQMTFSLRSNRSDTTVTYLDVKVYHITFILFTVLPCTF